MKILSVYDKEFARYGHVITGYDVRELLETLDRISPLPEVGTEYVPGNPVLEALPVAKQFAVNEYGGMPIQLGWCNGHNTKMNCLEYHRDSEVNLGTKDFILLLAKIDDEPFRQQMLQASDALEYERAAQLRDRMNAIEALGQKQLVTAGRMADTDAVGYYETEAKGCFAVLHYIDAG